MLDLIFKDAFKLQRQNDHVSASRKYAAILRADSQHVLALVNNAKSLRAQGKYQAAKIYYERALSIKSDDASFWSSYGNVLCDLHLYEEAEQAHQKALELGGESAEILYNASVVPFSNNNPALAIELVNRILVKTPDYHNAKWNRALSYLQLGDYKQGFAEYELRLNRPDVTKQNMVVPVWQGESLSGKRILLTREQGLGDMIQFSRFAQILNKQGAEVYIEAKPGLKRLMQCVSGIAGVVNEGNNGAGFDYYIPLMSLPHKLKIDISHLAETTSYIETDKITGKSLPAHKNKLRVGLVWASKPDHPTNRSCPLALFLPLFKHVGVEFYSFQVGPVCDDIYKLGIDGLLHDLAPKNKDFYDTAAFMKQMDLVISIDSSPVHLAGALGIETWLLLLHASDWRWLLNREDSPWYPSVKLYRQHTHGDWSQVISRLINDFSQLLTEKSISS